MSIWDSEIIRADGNFYAFIRVQNDFTGNISGSFRRIYQDKNGKYYCKIDGSNVDMSNKVDSYIIEKAVEREVIKRYSDECRRKLMNTMRYGVHFNL